ncbi:MAG TPA: amidohydrolase family protein, partial [Gemmatales bacterium]|nr:amidohydrolase family protein [Gemmatales bacterium]
LWEWAARQAIPVATHLAETFDELTLLADRTGPFAEFLERLNVWSPAALLASVEEPLHWTSTPWLIAHANYFPRSAWPTLSRHHVVYCPRTHAVFGHTPHPFAEMLESGLNVALGTDSLASNADLDLWQEVHHVWQHWPASLPPARLLAMATRHGALALGDAARGQLAPGTPADFVIVPLPADRSTADPHEGLYAASGAGRRVVQAGSFRN